ncbi:aminoglycoside 6'-N-acetyltransferase I [Anaerocolumna jejuensis DSM 15929]|uniref:Aminoglycoside N(6')-acetyltransferase type 1 n=1 Tax=Anaerocolumna jejuensis DSM 15929 TaxID=1121322 RepID=A0A1M6MCE1_9FIRM|nr:aminoglycoside 6'-N-acetyltransferase [Anaerocolumna jejuensis]SHJ81114.1 aminoglycoside 6'-N-acetyltransferase I [Anaerocolumna jejuensis DSM 15929]
MIKQAEVGDSRFVAELAMLLWPDNEINDLEKEMTEYIVSDKGVVFISFIKNVQIGFAQCSLRYDYVEGTESSPVGYLEGVFVKAEYRKRGIGKKLIHQCEEWAENKGCREFASDCELNNTDSLKLHLQLGFEEANRIICFKKKL